MGTVMQPPVSFTADVPRTGLRPHSGLPVGLFR